MECIFCETVISEKANFCPRCTNQIKCLNCKTSIEKDYIVCIECGTEIKSSKKENINTIEFSEKKNSRTFKANFTNDVGHSIGEALGFILSGKPQKNNLKLNSNFSTPLKNNTTEDVEYSEIDETSNNAKIRKVFRELGEKITLQETRLKAKSKRDYSIRLTIVFLYYKQTLGLDKVPRKDVTSILMDANVEDGNWRHWLVNNNLVGVHDDYVELKAPGREEAKVFLDEIFNPDIDDKWKLGSSKPSKRSKKKEEKSDE